MNINLSARESKESVLIVINGIFSFDNDFSKRLNFQEETQA